MGWQYVLGNIVSPIICGLLLIGGIWSTIALSRLERERAIIRDLCNLCFIGTHPIPLNWAVIYFGLSRKEFLKLYDRLFAQLYYYNSRFPDYQEEFTKDELLDLLFDHRFGK